MSVRRPLVFALCLSLIFTSCGAQTPSPSAPVAPSEDVSSEKLPETGDAATPDTPPSGITTPAPSEVSPEPPVISAELPPNTFTVVSYNIKNYLTMERRGKEELPKPETEIAALVSMIKETQPDVLGVSEIGTKEDLKDLQSRLAAAGIDLPHLEYCDGPDAYRNLGALSKFPFTSRNHQTNLSYRMGGEEFPFHRGIFDATVEPVPGFKLHLIGTHLKSKREVDDGDQAEMRRNEAELTRRHIESILKKDPQTNLLVFGDFNDTKQTDIFKVIRGNDGRPDHLYDLWLKDRFGFTWTHFWSYADIYSRIDYIFYSKALAPHILKQNSFIHHAPDWFVASDHRPLVVRILPTLENGENP